MSGSQIQPQDKYIVRLPEGMRDRIKREAEKNSRSMNAEIVATLEKAYPAVSEDFGPLFLALFDELMALADSGNMAALRARIGYANLRLARAGHGRIEFEMIEGPPLGVGSRNLDVAKRSAMLQQAAAKISAK